MEEVKLNIGCGVHVVKGFINVDKFFTLKDLKTKKGIFINAKIEEGGKFVQGDIVDLPFKNDYADYIECIDVIEHLPFRQVGQALTELRRVLKPGGKLVMLTSDFDSIVEIWAERCAGKEPNSELYYDLVETIYGNQLGPGEFHNTPFNVHILRKMLLEVGWKAEELKFSYYPAGCTDMPQFMAADWNTGGTMRVGMIYVKATK